MKRRMPVILSIFLAGVIVSGCASNEKRIAQTSLCRTKFYSWGKNGAGNPQVN